MNAAVDLSQVSSILKISGKFKKNCIVPIETKIRNMTKEAQCIEGFVSSLNLFLIYFVTAKVLVKKHEN